MSSLGSFENLLDMSLVLVRNEGDCKERQIEEIVYKLADSPLFENLDINEIKKVIKKVQNIEGISMEEASCIMGDDPNFVEWLTPERIEESFQNDIQYSEDYLKFLKTEENFPGKVVSRIDQATKKILGLCGDPANNNFWERRGMVVGSVQSGKTANYISLINKAADFGYKVIIVITGIHENLRDQTQKRVNEGFIGGDRDLKTAKFKKVGVGRNTGRRVFPRPFSSRSYDFDIAAARRNPIIIDESETKPLIFVIKKNTSILQRLISFFEGSPAVDISNKINLPLLIIDDEADNASINTKYKRGEVTKINSQIRKIINIFSRSSYVGYTATPFANIFIDPDSEELIFSYKKTKENNEHEYVQENLKSKDLFPRDFIVGLEPPDNYFGPKKLFSDTSTIKSSVITHITDSENYIPLDPKIHKRDLDPEIPPSLREAIICFFIQDAIKNIRGIWVKNDSSMMVNVSRFTQVQNLLKIKIEDEVKDIKAKIRSYIGLKGNTRKIEFLDYEEIFNKYFKNINLGWNSVLNSLKKTYPRIDVKVINQGSKERLEYKDKERKFPPKSYIVIGGFSLSRGLTLNGLTNSYILRNTLMYDTLLQMGRWFGYRPGYDDICRIWMTEDMKEDYEHVTSSVLELMRDLKELEKSGRPPIEFGLKVKSHPDSLLITARNKAGKAEKIKTILDFSGKVIETFAVPNNKKKLSSNFENATSLIKNSLINISEEIKSKPYHGNIGYLIKNIDCSLIRKFIVNFEATSYSKQLTNPGPIDTYINKRENRELKNWDIFIPSPEQGNRKSINVNNLKINTIRRKLRGKEPFEEFKLTDNNKVASSTVAKVGLSQSKIDELINYAKPEDKNNPKIFNCYGRKPLLVLHFIDLIDSSETYDIGLPEDMTISAYSIIFPESEIEEQVEEYWANDIWFRQLSLVELEDPDSEENLEEEYYD